jgi:hypothetical protein
VLDAAKRANVVVFGVTVSRSRNPFLKDLVDLTGGDVVEVKETSELRATFVKILAEYRLRYILGYSPTGVTAGGFTRFRSRCRRSPPRSRRATGIRGNRCSRVDRTFDLNNSSHSPYRLDFASSSVHGHHARRLRTRATTGVGRRAAARRPSASGVSRSTDTVRAPWRSLRTRSATAADRARPSR